MRVDGSGALQGHGHAQQPPTLLAGLSVPSAGPTAHLADATGRTSLARISGFEGDLHVFAIGSDS
jgi:hypothetical protein